MKKMIFGSLTLSTFALALLLTPINFVSAQTTKKFEPAKLRDDFHIARQCLEEGHPGLYRHTKKSDLDRIFDNTEKSLDHPMDFYEFYRLMTLPIAAIKCGHTDLSPSPEVQREIELLPRLPFDVRALGSRVFIFRDYAQAGALAGREILSINGVPADRILCTMLAAESQDGEIQTSRERVIAQHFGSNLILLLGLRAPYEMALAGSGTNQPAKVHVTGVKHEELVKLSKTLYPQDQGSKPFGDLKFLDDGKIAHLTYSFFGVNVEEGKTFMKHSFEAIQSQGSKTLILDLRGNLGGENELGVLLFSYLVSTPFKYYDEMIVNRMSGSYRLAKYAGDGRRYTVPEGLAARRPDGKIHILTDPLLGPQRPNKPTFTGTIYTLMDGRCFSTTAEFLTAVHAHHRATFIGEESAGGYYGNNSGDVPRITLPNTELGIYVPLVSYYMAVGGDHQHEAARGVIPDFPVQYTIADLLTGTDKEFALALDLCRKGRR